MPTASPRSSRMRVCAPIICGATSGSMGATRYQRCSSTFSPRLPHATSRICAGRNSLRRKWPHRSVWHPGPPPDARAARISVSAFLARDSRRGNVRTVVCFAASLARTCRYATSTPHSASTSRHRAQHRPNDRRTRDPVNGAHSAPSTRPGDERPSMCGRRHMRRRPVDDRLSAFPINGHLATRDTHCSRHDQCRCR